MEYRQYFPRPPLSSFVQCLWYSQGMQGLHRQERLLPNGESGIVFDLREQPLVLYEDHAGNQRKTYEPAVFCGARTDCFLIDTSQQERVIGIQFKAGGAFPFLDMPADAVAHATHALEHIWSTEATAVREQLLMAPSVDIMFRTLERALLAQLRKCSGSLNRHAHPAVRFAVKHLSQPGADVMRVDLADHVGLSSRRFIELFRRETGLTPKAFHRVRRFQHVLQKLRKQTQEHLADLALECGYYDQAHFNHDFLSFSGVTPGEYLKIATPHLNHLPIE